MTEPKLYQYVAVGLEGKGRVHWTETHERGPSYSSRYGTRTTRTVTLHYSDNEVYIDKLVVVWGNKEASQSTRLDPGTYNFPFQFTIPPNCPPTYETHNIIAEINYQLYGVVSSQVTEHECKVETPLVLNHLIDLNLQPDLLQPVEKSDVKGITWCCCCESGEAEITFKIQRGGFCVVQERIPVTFECKNGSSRQISVRVEVVEITTYAARSYKKSFKKVIGESSCQIPAFESDTSSVEFDLPSSVRMPLSTRIITVTHLAQLWITNALDCCSEIDGPTFSVPIAIGNVPFQGQAQGTLSPAGGSAPADPK